MTILLRVTESEILDAEYRAFVKALHPATVDALVTVQTWWDQRLFPSVSGANTTTGSLGSKLEHPEDELDDEYRYEIGPVLHHLVNGHPDPDVRIAADFLHSRLRGGLFYMDPTRAERQDGEEVLVAIHRCHDGLSALRRAIYHAPFRINRPEPEWDGVPVGNSEPLPSRVVKQARNGDSA